MSEANKDFSKEEVEAFFRVAWIRGIRIDSKPYTVWALKPVQQQEYVELRYECFKNDPRLAFLFPEATPQMGGKGLPMDHPLAVSKYERFCLGMLGEPKVRPFKKLG